LFKNIRGFEEEKGREVNGSDIGGTWRDKRSEEFKVRSLHGG